MMRASPAEDEGCRWRYWDCGAAGDGVCEESASRMCREYSRPHQPMVLTHVVNIPGLSQWWHGSSRRARPPS
eukprot:1195858-Prorocentrum_minimum.AAC.2